MWIRPIWDRYEIWFAKRLGLQPLGPDSMVQVRCKTYDGPVLQAGDQVIQPGAEVLEIHMRNLHLPAAGDGPGRTAIWAIHNQFRRDLLDLHRLMQESYPSAAGVVGESLLARGVRDLGFHAASMPDGLWKWWLTVYMSWLERLYHTAPGARRGKRRRREAKVIWMTAEELGRLADAGAS